MYARPAPGERDRSRWRRLFGLQVEWEEPFDLAEELGEVVGRHDADVARVIAGLGFALLDAGPRAAPPGTAERTGRRDLLHHDVCVLAMMRDEPHVHLFDGGATRIGLAPTFVRDLSYVRHLTVADHDGPRFEIQFTRRGAEVQLAGRDGSPASSVRSGAGDVTDAEGVVIAELVGKPEPMLVAAGAGGVLARYPEIGVRTTLRERRLEWLRAVVFTPDAPHHVRAAALAGELVEVREADRSSHIG